MHHILIGQFPVSPISVYYPPVPIPPQMMNPGLVERYLSEKTDIELVEIHQKLAELGAQLAKLGAQLADIILRLDKIQNKGAG